MNATKLASAALMAVVALSGCGSSAGKVGPTGVDEIVNPSPTPAATDFHSVADGVHNEWLPFKPGARWRYGSEKTAATATISVGSAPSTKFGIESLEVQIAIRASSGTFSGTFAVAEDNRNNLWLMGRPASLLWPDEPRVGDGWSTTAPSPEVDLITHVLAADSSVRVTTELVDVVNPATPTRIEWARGTGPVQLSLPDGDVLELVTATGLA